MTWNDVRAFIGQYLTDATGQAVTANEVYIAADFVAIRLHRPRELEGEIVEQVDSDRWSYWHDDAQEVQ